MSVASIYAAGKVRRWHSNPTVADTGQTNAEHQGGCVRLLLMLHPDPSVRLIRAVAHHDDGERWSGDMSHIVKAANPELAQVLWKVEREALARELGHDVFDGLTDDDQEWLYLVDKLEAYAHVAIHRSSELGRDSWPKSKVLLIMRADMLGVSGKVQDFIADMENGNW